MLGLEYGDQPSDVKQYVGHASEYITELLVSYFDSNNLAYDLTDFSGRSDYGPFLDFGIPAGGLDTGADGIKTEDERHRFGGMVGIQHDPCYHLHCDTIENLSQEALRDMSAAASYGLERLLAAPALGAWLDASTHNEQQLPAAFTKARLVGPESLNGHVSAVNITRHLEKLQEIAFASGGNRSVGSIGYNRSIEYVRSTLASSTDYLLSSQDFTYTKEVELEPPTLEQVLPSAASLVLDTEFNKMSGSGSGSVEAEVAHAANRGCDEADFDGTSFQGMVALIRRGTCTFQIKVQNAVSAGAVAVVMYNSGDDSQHLGVMSGTLGYEAPVPVLFTTYIIGAQSFAVPGSRLKVETHASGKEVLYTSNLCAESKSAIHGAVLLILVVGLLSAVMCRW